MRPLWLGCMLGCMLHAASILGACSMLRVVCMLGASCTLGACWLLGACSLLGACWLWKFSSEYVLPLQDLVSTLPWAFI